MMKITLVDGGNAAPLLEFVKRDPVDNFFFIHDWFEEREWSRFYMARDGGAVRGVCLIYRDRNFTVRGDREACEALLKHNDPVGKEVMIPIEHADLITDNYDFEISWPTYIMFQKRDPSKVFDHDLYKPVAEDAREISDLMMGCQKGMWTDMWTERVTRMLKEMDWFCVREEGRILALANTRYADFGSNIYMVATHKDHWGKGYATRVVKAAVSEISKRSEMATIHVYEDNLAARRVYGRCGFKEHRKYLVARGLKSKK